MMITRQQNTQSWVVHELRDDQLDKALPLIQISGQEASLEDWRKELRSDGPYGKDEGSGIAVIEDGDGYIFGLFCYRVRGVAGRKIITVGKIIVPDTVVPTLSHHFVEILDGFARDQGGEAVEILPEAAPPDSLLGAVLQDGFDYCPAHWTRAVPSSG